MKPPDSWHASQTGPSPALIKALRQALRPLLRVMLSRGITLPYLTELLKSVLVEVAERDFPLAGKPSSDSRVSLLTGVHRKDVNRLRHANNATGGAAAGTVQIPPVVSLGAQLVAQWLGNPQFLDEEGQPLTLPRNISEGGAQSFEALVAGINSDIRSRVVLDEWLRLGVVSVDDQRMVCLNTQAFVPAHGSDEKAHYFGHNLHDHAAAAAHNLLGQEPPFLERSLHFNGLNAEAIAALAAQSQKLGMQALVAVNKNALAREKETAPNEPLQRMTFGIYFYAEPATPPTAATPAPLATEPAEIPEPADDAHDEAPAKPASAS